MTKSTRTALIVIAAIFIAAGIGGIIFAFCGNFGGAASVGDDTTAETTFPEIIHKDVEYTYDDNGNLISQVFYKDNVYNGQIDYYRTENEEYITEFDKDNKEVSSTVTKHDALGNVSSVTTYKDGKVYETIEYDYHSDFKTPAKKTVKTYEGDRELAEKTYFSEEGKKTQVCKYEDGKLVSETFFDENGNVIEKGGDTVEE